MVATVKLDLVTKAALVLTGEEEVEVGGSVVEEEVILFAMQEEVVAGLATLVAVLLLLLRPRRQAHLARKHLVKPELTTRPIRITLLALPWEAHQARALHLTASVDMEATVLCWFRFLRPLAVQATTTTLSAPAHPSLTNYASQDRARFAFLATFLPLARVHVRYVHPTACRCMAPLRASALLDLSKQVMVLLSLALPVPLAFLYRPP